MTGTTLLRLAQKLMPNRTANTLTIRDIYRKRRGKYCFNDKKERKNSMYEI